MLILSILVASSANAGVVLTFENHVGDTQGQTMVMKVEGLRLRMDLPSEQDGASTSMIFLGDEDRLLAVNHSEKSYFQLDEETVTALADRLGGGMEQAMAAMQEQLKNLPPEQRAVAEKMMKERMPQMAGASQVAVAKPDIRRTSNRATVAGVACVDFEVWRGGVREQVMCVADWSKVPDARQAMAAMEAMAGFSERVLGVLQEKMGGQLGMPSNPFAELEALGGLPIRVREYDGGVLSSESILTSIVSGSVPTSLLSEPAGYRRTQMGM